MDISSPRPDAGAVLGPMHGAGCGRLTPLALDLAARTAAGLPLSVALGGMSPAQVRAAGSGWKGGRPARLRAAVAALARGLGLARGGDALPRRG